MIFLAIYSRSENIFFFARIICYFYYLFSLQKCYFIYPWIICYFLLFIHTRKIVFYFCLNKYYFLLINFWLKKKHFTIQYIFFPQWRKIRRAGRTVTRTIVMLHLRKPTQHTPLCRQKKLPSDARSITIKVKSEALTAINNLEHKHDTRCRK